MTLLVLVACTRPPESPPPGDDPGPTTADTGTDAPSTTSSPTGATGDTGEVPTLDCGALIPAADSEWTNTGGIVTEEDFDFDAQGWLLAQRDTGLQGIDRAGNAHFVAANIGPNATGIRSLASGKVVVLQPNTGAANLVDPATGAVSLLLGGLLAPNGIDAGADGMVYVSENTTGGRLRQIDPETGEAQVILQAEWMNGIVLSPDEQTLYFTSSSYTLQSRIGAVSRDASGRWDRTTTRWVYDHTSFVGGITVDACGNLYGVEYTGGVVFRVDPATGTAERLADLPEYGPSTTYPAIHFAPGYGGWPATSVFVTSRGEIYEIPTGVPGSHVLAPAR